MRDCSTLISIFVKSIKAIRSVRNAGCSIPSGAFWTGALEINALFSIKKLPRQASFIWIWTNADRPVVEGVWRASQINTGLTIPSLVWRTSRITTNLFGRQEDQIWWAVTFVCKSVVNLIVNACWNKNAICTVVPLLGWTNAHKKIFVPNLTIDTCCLGVLACSIVENLDTRTDAILVQVIPDLTSSTSVSNTIYIVPNSACRTFASPSILVPD